jgi:hypothetical protein
LLPFAEATKSTADFSADSVFLLVQGALFRAGDVATIQEGHEALFASNKPILPMQHSRFTAISVTDPQLMVNTAQLIDLRLRRITRARRRRRCHTRQIQ